jgi:hypothetical protein
MKHFQNIFTCLIALMINFVLIQTDLQSQDDSIAKEDTSASDANTISKSIPAKLLLVQKDSSLCDSNIVRKPKLKKIKKEKVNEKYFFSSLSLGVSKGKSEYINRDFGSYKISVGYWSKSIIFPLSLSAMYSEEIEETSGKPTIYQADIGLSAFLPWGEHYPFLVFELGGGVSFGNVRIINDSIINQKIEKIESTENFTSPYFSVSGELTFAGIGEDFSIGVMGGYSWNTKRSMFSLMLVVHYVRPF